MKPGSSKVEWTRALAAGVALLCLAWTGEATANTYFKCVDAKGAVTVQQAACAASSTQEERKVWTSGLQAAKPTAPPVAERPSGLRRTEEPAKAADR
jgi:hypothetical protein